MGMTAASSNQRIKKWGVRDDKYGSDFHERVSTRAVLKRCALQSAKTAFMGTNIQRNGPNS